MVKLGGVVALGILAMCESDEIEMVSSEALLFEIGRIPNPARREWALRTLGLAKEMVSLNDQVENRAIEFNAFGIKPLDALYLALAEDSQADFFCTCDDRLLKLARSLQGIKTKVVSQLELIEEIEL